METYWRQSVSTSKLASQVTTNLVDAEYSEVDGSRLTLVKEFQEQVVQVT